MQQKCVALISDLFTPKLTVAHWLPWQHCKYFAQAERSDEKLSQGEGKGGRNVRLVCFFFGFDLSSVNAHHLYSRAQQHPRAHASRVHTERFLERMVRPWVTSG